MRVPTVDHRSMNPRCSPAHPARFKRASRESFECRWNLAPGMIFTVTGVCASGFYGLESPFAALQLRV